MSDDDEAWSLDAQRRAFEAQFGSLESMGFQDNSKADAESLELTGDDSDGSDFGGFSDDDTEDKATTTKKRVQYDSDLSDELMLESDELMLESEDEAPRVVRLGETTSQPIQVLKKERRLLKLGRAPTLAELDAQQKLAQKQQEKELRRKAGSDDAENLKNDLELQRLLSESHILAHNLEYSGADLTLRTIDNEEPTGKARKRILDHRIREISATNSLTGGLPKRLEKMPMLMRKGMIDAQARRVAKYEQEAREAGIVLAKVRKGHTRQLNMGKGVTARLDRLGTGVKKAKAKKDKGLKIQAVGRSTANGLVISEREIARVANRGKGGKSRRR